MIFRKSQLVLIIFFGSFLGSCIVYRESNVRQREKNEVVKITQKELPKILEKIPLNYEENYGFHSREEFQNALAGTPFNCYTLMDNELKNSPTYRVPIAVDQEFRALVTVEYINDTYHVVDFGANVLAKEIQMVCNENPNMVFLGILRIYSINSDFLVMKKDQQEVLVPLTSAKMFLKSKNILNIDNYYTKDQVFKLVGI